MLVPDKFWENYELLFGVRYQAQLATVSVLQRRPAGFNVARLCGRPWPPRPEAGRRSSCSTSPTIRPAIRSRRRRSTRSWPLLRETADDGRNLVVVTDDAYFGLFYGEDVAQESLFARLAGSHARLLAVKVDGPTKEKFVWGFRTGMLTLSAAAACQAPRPSTRPWKRRPPAPSAAPSPTARTSPSRSWPRRWPATRIAAERQQKKEILEARAQQVQEILASPEYRRRLGALSLQRRLLHVPEAQGARRRDVPQASLEQPRRGRDRRRRRATSASPFRRSISASWKTSTPSSPRGRGSC